MPKGQVFDKVPIYILRNGPTGKYTFYGIDFQTHIHFTKCTYEQIYRGHITSPIDYK